MKPFRFIFYSEPSYYNFFFKPLMALYPNLNVLAVLRCHHHFCDCFWQIAGSFQGGEETSNGFLNPCGSLGLGNQQPCRQAELGASGLHWVAVLPSCG